MPLEEIRRKIRNLLVYCSCMSNGYGILVPPPISHRFRRIAKLAHQAKLHERGIIRQRKTFFVLKSTNLLQRAAANENRRRSYQGSAFSRHHVTRGRTSRSVEQDR